MLISASQALDMLSAHAPRGWAKRVLCWQVNVGEIALYFASGKLSEQKLAGYVLQDAADEQGNESVDLVRTKFGQEVADEVEKAHKMGPVQIRKVGWKAEPKAFPIEVVTFAHDIDWEGGSVSVFFTRANMPNTDDDEMFFMEDDSLFLNLDLHDMSFDLSSIEMLAPNAQIPKTGLILSEQISAPSPRKGGPGRMPRYDWEGALLFLIGEAEMNSVAQDPNARGAQAEVVKKLADWFSANGGDIPSTSQLQHHASRVLAAIRGASS